MGGVVLETLSTKKLLILLGILLVCQIVFFLIGGKIAPSPSSAVSVLGTWCVDKNYPVKQDEWSFSRSDLKDGKGCDSVAGYSDPKIKAKSIKAEEIVFTFQLPLPRDDVKLDYSRWFQNFLTVLQLDVEYDELNKMGDNPVMKMDIRLGYRNKWDPPDTWTELARSDETRALDCSIDEVHKIAGYYYNCSLLSLFELGSCHHDYYLVNIRLPTWDFLRKTPQNDHIGKLVDLHLITIHQNGGFTKVWFSLKTTLFPILLTVLIWFWRRVSILDRPPNLLEKMLLALGCSLSFLNLPIEWLTLTVNMPFMLLLTDIRQGIFYAMLMCFWIIFAGEHLMDQVERNKLVLYWKHLSAVAGGCICLFVFEMCERGVQLYNPFFSIWVTDIGTKLALAFVIMAGIAASMYFFFLSWMIYLVFRNISAKKSALPEMTKARRKYYLGLILRFKVLMLTTLLCAAMTVIFFIISQVSEGQWKWDEDITLEYTSAFFTGVYGMWNVYVFALLSLYAPSHKYKPVSQTGADGSDGSNEEEVEFTQLSTEQSSLAHFTQKAAAS
ncbi:protein wntless-like isoform X2 [Tubulanus polymorphus]|uniref:protein wntless-like isoform X2 n=1 Tax=Tubulanus polymorphus TaxID=672921 RepID=UPI003DA6A136